MPSAPRAIPIMEPAVRRGTITNTLAGLTGDAYINGTGLERFTLACICRPACGFARRRQLNRLVAHLENGATENPAGCLARVRLEFDGDLRLALREVGG